MKASICVGLNFKITTNIDITHILLIQEINRTQILLTNYCSHEHFKWTESFNDLPQNGIFK